MGKEDTRRLKQIMTSAGEEAKRLGNSKIYPEHLFLGLLKLRSGSRRIAGLANEYVES